tara:strand:- start:1098 stop:1835 length:738 start_codon:yes stop_codon:yes gene_type:complete
MNKLLSIVLLLSTSFVFAQATDDNEIKITQSGDTLELYIDQIGFGNKIGGNDFSSGSGTSMSITGSSLEFDLDFTGNQNVLFGPVVADSSVYKLEFIGDSNEIDWNIGYIGSADSSDILFDVTGDSNTYDLDQGYVYSAERLDADLLLVGSSNVFDIDWESDDNIWDFDITGDSNNVNTLQNDGAQNLEFTLVGDSADVDINQISGTCATGAGVACASPNANIVLDVTSDNATIQLNQKDSANDS